MGITTRCTPARAGKREEIEAALDSYGITPAHAGKMGRGWVWCVPIWVSPPLARGRQDKPLYCTRRRWITPPPVRGTCPCFSRRGLLFGGLENSLTSVYARRFQPWFHGDLRLVPLCGAVRWFGPVDASWNGRFQNRIIWHITSARIARCG